MSISTSSGAQSSEKPRVHPAEWSLQQVASFWDNYGSIAHFRDRFFSLTMGEGVLEFAQKFVPAGGTFLDYGCGRGDLLEVLIRRGTRAMGCDSSPDSVRAIEERFGGKENFLGAFQTPVSQVPVVPDTILLVEVIEHMPKSAVNEFLTGVGALLKPGGHVVITCPNGEDIVSAEVLCPECACRFHPVQHMQSLTPDVVESLAGGAGFQKVFSGATRLRRTGEWAAKAWTIARLRTWFGRPPHLVYVGRKL